MNIIIGVGLQRAYMHKRGTKYLGETAEILKVRLLDFFKRSKSGSVIFLTREIHQTNDTFFKRDRSHSVVGSPDVEIPEVFKAFPNFIVNTNRYSAFYKTALEAELRKKKPEKITLVGVETQGGVLFTAEELRNRGYDVTVPEALIASSDPYLHAAGINILSNVLSVDVE